MSDVLVLCYHAISPSWTAALSTTPASFERQISLLVKRGYRGVTFTEAVATPRPDRPRDRVVAVTFDDAYRSVMDLARPILDRYGLPATVFAPTDFIDAQEPLRWSGVDVWLGGPHEDELVPMSWADLQTLIDAGWEIGSHTGSHPHLTELDDRALMDELGRSKAACEHRLTGACASLAYPYGDVDARVVAATVRAGYRAAAALPQGRLGRRDPLSWPRIGIYHVDDDRRFSLKISPTIRRLRGSAAAGLPGILRRVGRRLR
jgi:peptidoglycan/xylan/chitin deacetylase (PgdA/CDA1 family)